MKSLRATALVALVILNISSIAHARVDGSHLHPYTHTHSHGYAVADVTGEAAQVGRWSSPFWEGGLEPFDPPSAEKSRKFPAAVSAVVLPDGRALYWNGVEGAEDGKIFMVDERGHMNWGNSRARILDLRSGEASWSIPDKEYGTTDEQYDHHSDDGNHSSTHDLFCADHKLLYDGTVLIAGGTEVRQYGAGEDVYGDDETRIFDPGTDSFSSVEPMREPRWYPSLVTLSDGKVLVVSGLRRIAGSATYAEPGFSHVRLSEIYDAATRRWTDAGTSESSLPLYPRLHLLPDGTVFYGSAAEYWTPLGQTADQATWARHRFYDPSTGEWKLGDADRYGGRSGASSALLRLEPPYDSAKIVIAGGTVGTSPGTGAATTVSEIVHWTADGLATEGTAKAPLAGLAGDETQLRNPRWHGTPLMLATGELMLFNGGDTDDALDPGSAAAIRTPELYDAKTRTWHEMAPGGRDRVYHSTVALLPDGRVLVGGNVPLPTHYTNNDNPVARHNTHRDSTFEIYEPPYLFRGPRPEITEVMPVAGGRALKLSVGAETKADDISEVVLVRLATTTHGLDSDIRAVKLDHTVAGTNLFAELPKGGDGRILPPGPYYVFALRDSDKGLVPSIAHVVLIQPTGDGRVAARAT